MEKEKNTNFQKKKINSKLKRHIFYVFLLFIVVYFTLLLSCIDNSKVSNLIGESEIEFQGKGRFYNFIYDFYNLTVFISEDDLKDKSEQNYKSLLVFFVNNDFKQCEKNYIIGYKFGKYFICHKEVCAYRQLDLEIENLLLNIINAIKRNKSINYEVNIVLGNKLILQNNDPANLTFLGKITEFNEPCFEAYVTDFKKKLKVRAEILYS
ncbi:MAG: hypothetical protein QXS41_03090 [Candidatus Woesearchaeota archaeon]